MYRPFIPRWLPLLVGATAVLTACSAGQSSSNHPAGLNARQIAAEYHAEARTLALPPGESFPQKNYDTKGAYQAGIGRNDADSFWFCSWVGRYLDASGRSRASAFAHVRSVKDTYMYLHSYDDNTRAITDKELSAADLGDPGPLRNDYQVNCA